MSSTAKSRDRLPPRHLTRRRYHPGTMRRFLCQSTWIVILLAVVFLNPLARAASDELPCASSREQIWFVLESRPHGNGFNLCHHAADMGGPYLKSQSWLTRAPIAIAAWKNRVWIVFAPQSSSNDPRREIYTLSVQKSPMLDAYFSDPSGRLDIVTPLPAEGTLVSFVATEDGPVALIAPSDRVIPLQPSTQPRAAASAASDQAKLFQLDGQQWGTIALPDDLDARAALRLGTAGADGNDLRLIASVPGSPDHAIQYLRNAQGQWVGQPLDIDMTRIRDLVNANGQALAVLARDGDAQVELAYIRPSGLTPLARFTRPSNGWGITASGNLIQLIEQSPDGAVSMREIQPLTGHILPATAITSQPLTASSLWRLSMVMAFAVSLLVLIFVIGPIPKQPVSLPAGFAPVPATVRFLALLIDMSPAAIFAGLILRAPMTSVFNMPLLTWNLEQSQPYLLMAGLTLLHSFAGELMKGTSLGKAVLGARIVSVDGSPMRPRQAIVRTIVKGVLFLIPPLVLVALFNTHMRGLADLGAGTIVIHREEPSDQAENQDR